MAYTDRKKTKKYEKMDWAQKESYRTDQMEYYGLDRIDNGDEITGRGGYDTDAENAAIVRAMNNDYDIRESIKYGKDSGDKRFQDLGKGISNMQEATMAARAVQKYGLNEMDHKKVSSSQDYANISDNLFNKSRDNYGEQFASKDDLSALEKEQAATVNQTQEPYKESESLTNAKDRVQAWEQSNAGTDPSPYGAKKGMDFKSMAYGANSNRDASGEPANGEQAQGQLDKFKSELKQRKNIKPNF